MVKTKLFLTICIVVCALLFPSSASAASSSDHTIQTKSFFSQLLSGISSLLSNKENDHDSNQEYQNDYNKELKKEKEKEKEREKERQKEKEAEKWIKEKGNNEDTESKDIWEKWYCY